MLCSQEIAELGCKFSTLVSDPCSETVDISINVLPDRFYIAFPTCHLPFKFEVFSLIGFSVTIKSISHFHYGFQGYLVGSTEE